MEKLNNFIPISRKLFEHRFWVKKRQFSKFEAWLDLIASARYQTTEGSMLIGNKIIRWRRGEQVASHRFLGERWQWPKTKVIRYLALLKNEEMIDTRFANGLKITIITICKYDVYNTVKPAAGPERNHLGATSGPGEDHKQATC